MQPTKIQETLEAIASLESKIPGIVEISCAKNTSEYSEGYTHVILVRAESQMAIDAYRNHPDHMRIAGEIGAMEEHGIGVDFVT